MFLLVPAQPGCPGQNSQSRKTVVCVCVCFVFLLHNNVMNHGRVHSPTWGSNTLFPNGFGEVIVVVVVVAAVAVAVIVVMVVITCCVCDMLLFAVMQFLSLQTLLRVCPSYLKL